jgi:hypothetical protein
MKKNAAKKKFTLYWLHGKKEVIEGESVESAFNAAGIGAGAIRALDFYANGDLDEYDYNKEERTWKRKI